MVATLLASEASFTMLLEAGALVRTPLTVNTGYTPVLLAVSGTLA